MGGGVSLQRGVGGWGSAAVKTAAGFAGLLALGGAETKAERLSHWEPRAAPSPRLLRAPGSVGQTPGARREL